MSTRPELYPCCLQEGGLAPCLVLTVATLLSRCSLTYCTVNAPWLCAVLLRQLYKLTRRGFSVVTVSVIQMSAQLASSPPHRGRVTVGSSCISSLWFADVFCILGSIPLNPGRSVDVTAQATVLARAGQPSLPWDCSFVRVGLPLRIEPRTLCMLEKYFTANQRLLVSRNINWGVKWNVLFLRYNLRRLNVWVYYI